MKKRNISIPLWTKERPQPCFFFSGALAITFFLIFPFGFVSCNRQKAIAPLPRTNSPPVISAVQILPEKPVSDNDLTVSILCDDRDGDPMTYEYQWMKNDHEMSGETENVLRRGQFQKGDVIGVKVTPKDEEEKGVPVVVSVKVLNSPPVVKDVWIEPKVAYATDSLKAFCMTEDKDRDFIYLSYRWERNGLILADEKSDILARGRFKKGDSMAVSITPDDREVLGNQKKSNAVVILNSPPVIISSPPSRIAGNSYTYQVTADDPDNEPVTFSLKASPKGMKINNTSGLIQWDIKKEDSGTFPVEIEASDAEGAKSIQKYTLTVDFK